MKVTDEVVKFNKKMQKKGAMNVMVRTGDILHNIY